MLTSRARNEVKKSISGVINKTEQMFIICYF